MKNALLLLLVCSALCSCSTTLRVSSNSKSQMLKEISTRSASETFVIALKNRSNLSAPAAHRNSLLRFSMDSCFWLGIDGISIQSVSIQSIDSIVFCNRMKGLAQGLGIGAIGGIIIGGVIASQGTPDAPQPTFLGLGNLVGQSLDEKAAVNRGLNTAAVVVALGAVSGSIFGSHTTYVFDP